MTDEPTVPYLSATITWLYENAPYLRPAAIPKIAAEVDRKVILGDPDQRKEFVAAWGKENPDDLIYTPEEPAPTRSAKKPKPTLEQLKQLTAAELLAVANGEDYPEFPVGRGGSKK